MDNTIKPLSRLLLLLILMMILCLPVLANCNIGKVVYSSSAPEFTLDFIESSYYVPPTYNIDQYTGKTVIDHPGHNVENKHIVITIKNQEFTASVNGTKYYMAYNVAIKGHFGEEWKERDFASTKQFTMKQYLSKGFPRASDSDYTVLRVPASNYPVDTQLDVKVQAYIGYESVIRVTDYFPDHAILIPAGSHDEDGIIFDTAGDWSEIQTITLNVPTPVDQLNLILIGALILIPIAAYLGGIIYINKRKHSS